MKIDKTTLKIFFVYSPEWSHPEKRGSTIMRAFVPAMHLKKKFNYNTFCLNRLDVSQLNQNDIVIFMKCNNHPDVNIARSKKCICIYDPVDNFDSFANNDKFNFFIAASKAHIDFLAINHKINSNKCIIIDHLSTNITNLIADAKYSIPTVGAVQPVHEHNILKLLPNFCKTIGSIFTYKDSHKETIEFCQNTGNKQLFSLYKDINIGISVYDINTERGKERVNQKPSTKLSAFSSYCIPCVLTKQNSYSQYLEKYDLLNNLIVESDEEIFFQIEKLSKDNVYYNKCRDVMMLLRNDFHMDNVERLYVDQVINLI